MEFALIAVLFLSAIGVLGSSSSVAVNDCTWFGAFPDPTAIFNDLAIPYPLTQVEAYYPANCSDPVVATVQWSVIIDDTTFTAESNVITFTDPLDGPLFVTRTYAGVTITSLTPGQILAFTATITPGPLGLANSTGQLTVQVPLLQSHEVTQSAKTATSFATTTVTVSAGKSNGASARGISGLIVEALVLLGALAFF